LAGICAALTPLRGSYHERKAAIGAAQRLLAESAC
jgi:hypothetical protein